MHGINLSFDLACMKCFVRKSQARIKGGNF
jgi:hypothetical protein